jgi:hypothetical protein
VSRKLSGSGKVVETAATTRSIFPVHLRYNDALLTLARAATASMVSAG